MNRIAAVIIFVLLSVLGGSSNKEVPWRCTAEASPLSQSEPSAQVYAQAEPHLSDTQRIEYGAQAPWLSKGLTVSERGLQRQLSGAPWSLWGLAPSSMFMALMLAGGVGWMIAYVLIIRHGFRDRTYGMPIAALCANLSWEAIFSFIYPPFPMQRAVNILWLSLDFVIVYQALRFGPRELPNLSSRGFYTLFGLTLATAFCGELFITREFQDWSGAYAAFGVNLLMSVLFVSMLYRRQSLRGQSLGIAIAKLCGTTFISLAFFFFSFEDKSRGGLMNFLYIASFLFDVIYVMAVRAFARSSTREPVMS